MSCIYGPHQFGNEDQGWIAYFLYRSLAGLPLTIYGDGKQVRDALYVDDLVDALLLAQSKMGEISGRAFNIGGGTANAVSLLEVVNLIEEMHGHRPQLRFDGWRVGDQQYYVTDFANFHNATGWSPQVSVREGIRRLYHWLLDVRRPAPALSHSLAPGYEHRTHQSQMEL
jgi:CDP-paratose 2-epimerase